MLPRRMRGDSGDSTPTWLLTQTPYPADLTCRCLLPLPPATASCRCCSVPGVYAVGDVAAFPLTSVATGQESHVRQEHVTHCR